MIPDAYYTLISKEYTRLISELNFWPDITFIDPSGLDLLNVQDDRSNKYEYVISLIVSISDMIQLYIFASAINRILYFVEDQEIQNNLKYNWRNNLIKRVIPDYFTILDYTAFMMNELTGEKLIEPKNGSVRDVSFKRFGSEFEKQTTNKKVLGIFSSNDLTKVAKILSLASQNVSDVVERFRHVVTHRYAPGIDIMSISTFDTNTKITAKSINEMMHSSISIETNSGRKQRKFAMRPEFTFQELSDSSSILLNNLKLIFIEILGMDLLRDIVVTGNQQ